jgi:hypothetical protein
MSKIIPLSEKTKKTTIHAPAPIFKGKSMFESAPPVLGLSLKFGDGRGQAAAA